MRYLFVASLLAIMLSACLAPVRKNQTVCTEYRNLRCASTVTCSMDQKRGCQVCACDSIFPDQFPNPVAPDKQTPR